MANAIITRLTNKVGPLPAWAWAAIPATAYVAWSYYRASRGDSVISDETGTPTMDQETYEYGLNTGGASLPGYGSMPNGSSNLPAVETPKPTNATWFRQASNYLISEGFKPSDIITALNAYIYGSPDKVNQEQLNALQRALIYLGAAPEPAFMPETTPNTPNPVPTPTPTPTPKLEPVKSVAAVGGKGVITITWVPSPTGVAATKYRWQINRGTTSIHAGYTLATKHTQTRIQPGIYSVHVWAVGRDGKPSSSKSATVTVS